LTYVDILPGYDSFIKTYKPARSGTKKTKTKKTPKLPKKKAVAPKMNFPGTVAGHCP
jgi:hypothetical protein